VTVLAMHQPNYLPWIGFFDKLRRCDVFVLLDEVQYPRGGSVANRNRIRTGNGTLMLTVPVSKPPGSEGKALYREVRFADLAWRQKHLRSIQQAHARAPHFDRLFAELRELIEGIDSFCDLNVALIRWMAESLGIATRIALMSELGSDFGPQNQLIIKLATATGCTEYLSGAGGAAYNDAELLAEAGVTLRYQDFQAPRYPQLGEGFLPDLSALDMLLNCGGWPGPDAAEIRLAGTA
jgi:WbqC-like protein family